MALKFVPPFLKKLAAEGGPLVDNSEIQDEIARMKVRYEREDRASRGDLFAGPVSDGPKPQAGRSLPFPELSPSEPGPSSLDRPPVPKPDPLPPLERGLPFGLVAPPDAPPPPLPADRPPGTFRFEEEPDAE